jgi:hypothetical protein
MIDPDPSTAVKEQMRLLGKRIAILGPELDRLALDADERSRSVDSKASFLSIAAGIVVASQFQNSWNLPWFVVSVPLLFAVMAIAAAAVALLPSRRVDLRPDLIVANWLDTTSASLQIEKTLIEQKSQIAVGRENSLRRRGVIVAVGFLMLFFSVAALLVLYSINSAIQG